MGRVRLMERHDVCAAFLLELLSEAVRADALDMRGLLDAKPSSGREFRRGEKADAHGASLGVHFHGIKLSGVESQLETRGRYVDAHAEGIERGDADDVTFHQEISAKREPAEFRMINDIGGGVEGVAEEIGTVVAGERVEGEHVRKRVERGGGETLPDQCW